MEALFRTVSETPEPLKARLKGKLPPWLKGTLLRVGPGQFEVGSQAYNHLFDGLALIHRFNIQDGEVTYQNRFERSDCFLRAQQENRIVVSEFGTRAYPDPCKSIFSRFFSYFKSEGDTDNNLVNLMPVGNEVYAMTETPLIRRIDPQTLESGKEKVDYSKYVAVNQITAHPHIEPDGTIYNFGTRYGKGGVYALVKIPPTDEENNPIKQASILGTIPTKWSFWPSYHHSFGITENYVVFIEQPMVINVFKLMLPRFLTPKGYGGAFEFYKKTPVQFHVIDKATGKELTTTYLADAFFTFHHINTYEEEGHIVVDACCYENGEIIQDLFLEHLKKAGQEPAIAKRYVLPLPDSKAVKCGENLVSLSYGTATAVRQEDGAIYCTPEVLSREPVELCQINYGQYNKKKYRYFYGMSWGKLDKLVKVDTYTKETKLWSDEGCFPSEPVFVPAPDADKEDAGVVLSLVVKSSGDARSVFLLVLDGETFTELARAEVPSPAEAAMTFHGIFRPEV